MMRAVVSPAIELLEARIAPATLIDASTVIYTDDTGDVVTVKSSQPIFEPGLFEFTFVPAGSGEQLQELRLDATAAGANIRFEVTAPSVSSTDQRVNVGFIDAGGVDLGRLRVDGDLGRVTVGDADPTTPALETLRLGSLGKQGLATQGADPSLVSKISGSVAKIRVDGDIVGARLQIIGSVEMLSIGGSVIGGEGDRSGNISASAGVAEARVSGNIQGAAGEFSGRLKAASFDLVSIGGFIAGGSAEGSGQVFSEGSIGFVKVAGDVVGGTAVTADPITNSGFLGSGNIYALDRLDRVEIGGGILGGSGTLSGAVVSRGATGTLEVHASIEGGGGFASGTVRAENGLGVMILHGSLRGGGGSHSGTISGGVEPLGVLETFQGIASLRIDREVQGGSGSGSGRIEASQVLGFVQIGGALIGGPGDLSGSIDAAVIDVLFINGEVRGGTGSFSGYVHGSKVGLLDIGGSVRGSSSSFSGYVEATRIDCIRVGGDLLGSTGLSSGRIFANGSIGDFELSGSIVGGSGEFAGVVSSRVLKLVEIHGDIRESRTDYPEGTEPLTRLSGVVFAGRIGSMTVSGSISAADRSDLLEPITSYAIYATGKIRELHIRGDIVGQVTNRAGISAGALSLAGGPFGNEPFPERAGIGVFRVNGNISNSDITAGYGATDSNSHNPDALIGSAVVRGNWEASSLAAGIHPGADGFFGTSDDFAEAPGTNTTAAISRIARLVIAGQVTGTTVAGDAYGFEAQQIDFASLGAQPIPLTPFLDNIPLAPATDDVRLRELPAG